MACHQVAVGKDGRDNGPTPTVHRVIVSENALHFFLINLIDFGLCVLFHLYFFF